jgi:hypothetical protein
MAIAACFIGMALIIPSAFAQVFPPGTFRIDGIPVSCGANVTILNPGLRDVGSNDLQGRIFINPYVLSRQPTALKLFWYAHECGHTMVGPNESDADCWAIKTGKSQGWFTPDNFPALIRLFANNPGDWTHLPGPARVRHIEECYGADDGGRNNNVSSRRQHDSDDSGNDCSSSYRECTSNIQSIDDCMQQRTERCMSSCEGEYHYPAYACSQRFCNPDMGSNTSWISRCREKAREARNDCAEQRDSCRDNGR